jgi:hypothetical protein
VSAGMHQFPAGFREQATPHADPWTIIALVTHDLSAHGIKASYGPEVDLRVAVTHAAALLEALGVAAVVPEEEDPS